MDQGPYLEANDRSDNQEIPSFYGTRGFITVFPKAPRDLVLSQMNPADLSISYVFQTSYSLSVA
jgi:hypothetical protein